MRAVFARIGESNKAHFDTKPSGRTIDAIQASLEGLGLNIPLFAYSGRPQRGGAGEGTPHVWRRRGGLGRRTRGHRGLHAQPLWVLDRRGTTMTLPAAR